MALAKDNINIKSGFSISPLISIPDLKEEHIVKLIWKALGSVYVQVIDSRELST